MSADVSTGRTSGETSPDAARDGHDGAVDGSRGGEHTGSPSGEVAALLDELRRYLELAPQLSLPPRAFTSPELYELERTRVFGRSWVLVAHRDDLAEPNSYVSFDIAGEQVVVTRDADGVLHGMSPICRHRMMPLVESGAVGSAESFTCPYHLWRYGLDGRLIGATHMRKNPDFDPRSCRLPAFAVEEWHGFVYVNLDAAAAPLAPRLSRISDDLANYRLDDMAQLGSWSEEWACNWKVAVENAHENYHVLGFHPETLGPSTPGGSDTDVRVDSPWALRLLIRFAKPQDAYVLPLTAEEKAHLYGFFVFPAASLAAAGEMVIWLSLIPQTIDRTLVRGGILVPRAALDGADLDEMRRQAESYAGMINSEDRHGLEAVQRAVGSRFAGRGHLSPKEPGVVAFYQSLARALLRDDDDWPGDL
ncbi:aromatic ring-hydroxylating dioxygenase subunit alpha [Streptomyces sp. NPDC056405]|uniref:aromatic ring-hydroxylating oxygenase subunit alpha n=1 Tax=Streptomyces sp. NPDC056405 TaxID=3345811 RepID=UPI0035D9AE06